MSACQMPKYSAWCMISILYTVGMIMNIHIHGGKIGKMIKLYIYSKQKTMIDYENVLWILYALGKKSE